MATTNLDLSGTTLTVSFHGQLNAAAAGELRPRIRQRVAEGAKDVVFDLGNVDVVDSSGIGLIVATFNSVQKGGGGFSVVGVSAEVRKVFTAMRLDRRFRVEGPGSEAAR